MNTKAFFPSGEGSNLILGISMENQIFFLRTPAVVVFFTKLSKNDTLASLGGITGGIGHPPCQGASINAPCDGGSDGHPP